MITTLMCVSLNAQTETKTDSNKTAAAEAKTRKKAFRPTKDQVTQAQTMLKGSGSYKGAEDGRYNEDFRSAIKNYQEANELEKTGKLDEETLEKMGIEMTDNQKGIETADSSDSDKPKRIVFRPDKEQIMQAQTMLKGSGSFDGEADGKYSKELRAAIRDYQTANGLKRSGSLNRATLEKMKIELTETQMAIPVDPDDFASADDGEKKKRGAVFRATKDQVMTVQKMLKTAGLYTGEEDGKFNADFRSAIKEWQKQNNVKETGTLNKETLEAMKIELTDKQKDM